MTQTKIFDDKLQFDLENDQLLEALIEQRFLSNWKRHYQNIYVNGNGDTDNTSHEAWQNSMLELFITADCNQHCEYCYLVKHKQELYPHGHDEEQILKNLNIIINHCIDNHYYITDIQCFTGEILHRKFGLQVLDTLIDGIKNGWCIRQITWSSNMSFLFDENQTNEIQKRLNIFESYGISFNLSASVDGKYCEDGRPLFNGKIRDDEYYEKLFTFQKVNHNGFHPMVSALNVKNWIKNFDWWVSMCQKYDLGIFERCTMALEVRDPNWTDEAIDDYNKLMDHMIDVYYDAFDHDISLLAQSILNLGVDHPAQLDIEGYTPWELIESVEAPGCTSVLSLTVRLQDLMIIPCHRLGYDRLAYGKLKVENDKIVGIKAINPYVAIKILYANQKLCVHRCDTCRFKDVCIRQCMGCCYENENDPFIPMLNVCNFFEKKYTHLIKSFERRGILDYYRYNLTADCIRLEKAQMLLSLYDEVIRHEQQQLTKSTFTIPNRRN